MALYQAKPVKPVPFEALKLSSGAYVMEKNGQAVTVPAAEFEKEYEPVPLPQQG